MTEDDRHYFKIRDEAYELGIGRTPLAPIGNKGNNKMYAKLEYFNRFKSIKDRASFFMISDMIHSGMLTKEKVILEASSGNTGIAIANIARMLGISAEIIVPAGSSPETKDAIRRSGQSLTVMDGDSQPGARISIDPAIEMVKSLIKEHPEKYVNLDQYSNRNNTLAHYYTTGPEIVEALSGKYPTHVVVCIGTGGTLTGLATYFKKFSPSTKIIGVEPEKGHHIQGLKNLSVSKVPEIIDRNRNLVDEWITVTDEMAISETKSLLKHHGLFVGLSSGANAAAAMKVAESTDKGTIVTVFPDSAEKYRSVFTYRGMFTEKEFDENIHLVSQVPKGR
ncbi:MAG: cysteine synthase family protein [Thermoplasmataceae archaeon]